MKFSKQFFLFLLSFLLFQNTYSQLTGLWEVTKVNMGTESKTPIARWFRINIDQTYQAGNGWLQNSEGTWTFDKKTQEYLPKETNGIKDDFGAFKVSFENKQMIWKRQEEGIAVIIILKKIKDLPKSTADKMQGLWDLEAATKNGEDLLQEIDPKNQRFIQIRWDRIFVMQHTLKGRLTGYWHIHGHRPEVVLMYHDNTIALDSFMVHFEREKMIWVGKSANQKGISLTFTKIFEFPK